MSLHTIARGDAAAGNRRIAIHIRCDVCTRVSRPAARSVPAAEQAA